MTRRASPTPWVPMAVTFIRRNAPPPMPSFLRARRQPRRWRRPSSSRRQSQPWDRKTERPGHWARISIQRTYLGVDLIGPGYQHYQVAHLYRAPDRPGALQQQSAFPGSGVCAILHHQSDARAGSILWLYHLHRLHGRRHSVPPTRSGRPSPTSCTMRGVTTSAMRRWMATISPSPIRMDIGFAALTTSIQGTYNLQNLTQGATGQPWTSIQASGVPLYQALRLSAVQRRPGRRTHLDATQPGLQRQSCQPVHAALQSAPH